MPDKLPPTNPDQGSDAPDRRPTVVLLPGLLCDAAVWEPQRLALPHAHCIVPDYGLHNSLTAMARGVLGSVDAPLLNVVGHSMGGRVALEMARLAPGRVARIALLDTGYQPLATGTAGDTERRDRLALLQLAREQGMRTMGQSWAKGMVLPAHLDAPVFQDILAMIERKTPAIFEAQIQALLDRPDASPVLRALRCPALLLCGRHDAWSPLARHQEMQAMLPQADLVVIEEAGHMTTMEQPGAVNAALQRWLES